MNKIQKTQQRWVAGLVIVCCSIMAFIDAVVQPAYHIKSIVKIMLFLIVPIVYSRFNKEISLKKLFIPSKKGFAISLFLGVGTFAVIISAYFIFRNIFDLSVITTALTESLGVSKENFVAVSIYISFVNSLLEEFFFRGFAFLTLMKLTTKRNAYIFSSVVFAGYHIAMMIGWFTLPAFVIAMSGLILGGLIFSYLNQRNQNIYSSWMVHMFANFATNTVGFILFGII